MPSRILSQKINVSSSISRLSPLEEVLFIHLIVSCDDYGRFYGHPDIVRGMLFSRREFSSKQIENALVVLEKEGMIRRYECDDQIYIELRNWMKFQKPRAKESKFPEPPEFVEICEQIPTDAHGKEAESTPDAPKPTHNQRSQERFETFWEAYPKKQGKKAAEKAFERANVDDELLGVMLKAIEKAKQTAQWRREGGQFIPYPATWLNQGRWEDEPMVTGALTTQQQSSFTTYQPNHHVTDGQSGNPFRK